MRDISSSVYDLSAKEKERVGFIAWDSFQPYGELRRLREELIKMGFHENYVKGIAPDGDVGIFSSWHPIFSMSQVRNHSVVPEALRNLCGGPIDGWYSDEKDGSGRKYVCHFSRDDGVTLFFCFGLERGVHRGTVENPQDSQWLFKALLMNVNGEDWYVCDGCPLSDFQSRFWTVVGPMTRGADFLTWDGIVHKLGMKLTQKNSPLHLC